MGLWDKGIGKIEGLGEDNEMLKKTLAKVNGLGSATASTQPVEPNAGAPGKGSASRRTTGLQTSGLQTTGLKTSGLQPNPLQTSSLRAAPGGESDALPGGHDWSEFAAFGEMNRRLQAGRRGMQRPDVYLPKAGGADPDSPRKPFLNLEPRADSMPEHGLEMEPSTRVTPQGAPVNGTPPPGPGHASPEQRAAALRPSVTTEDGITHTMGKDGKISEDYDPFLDARRKLQIQHAQAPDDPARWTRELRDGSGKLIGVAKNNGGAPVPDPLAWIKKKGGEAVTAAGNWMKGAAGAMRTAPAKPQRSAREIELEELWGNYHNGSITGAETATLLKKAYGVKEIEKLPPEAQAQYIALTEMPQLPVNDQAAERLYDRNRKRPSVEDIDRRLGEIAAVERNLIKQQAPRGRRATLANQPGDIAEDKNLAETRARLLREKDRRNGKGVPELLRYPKKDANDPVALGRWIRKKLGMPETK